MSDQSPFPPNTEFDIDMEQWLPGGMSVPRMDWAGRPMPESVMVDEQGVALSLDDTLRVREQAVHSASLLFDTGAQFPEDDVEKIVSVAKRFEAYIRSGK